MSPITSILVPTDFSDFSLVALDYILSSSAFTDVEIYLLNVLESDSVPTFHSVDRHSETALRDHEVTARNILNNIIASKNTKGRAIVPVVRRGDPAKEIVRFAEQQHVDLIVMATHGRTGLAHILIGSVAEKVVRHARTPVLTVKPQTVSESLLKDEDLEEQLHLKMQ